MDDKNKMFVPVETIRASQAVYNQIESLILNKRLAVGQKLPSERELMKLYHKSHQTIREALRMLENMGYIEVKHGGAAVVSYSSDVVLKENLLDLLQHGDITLEQMIQFICDTEELFLKGKVKNVSWESSVLLHKALDRMKEHRSPREHAKAFIDFHRSLIKITQNMLLYVVWESFYQHMDTVHIKGTIKSDEVDRSIELHERLCDMLNAKNEQRTLAVLREISDLYRKVLER